MKKYFLVQDTRNCCSSERSDVARYLRVANILFFILFFNSCLDTSLDHYNTAHCNTVDYLDVQHVNDPIPNGHENNAY